MYTFQKIISTHSIQELLNYVQQAWAWARVIVFNVGTIHE